MKIIKSHGNVKIEYNFHGCPDCGDSIQTVTNTVYNHGSTLELRVAFCADCLDVKGWILVDTNVTHE